MNTLYDPQDSGAPQPFNPALPLVDDTQPIDQFTSAIQWTQWHDWCASSTPAWLITTWQSIAAQLTPTADPGLIGQLNTITTQMAASAAANCLSGSFIVPLANVYSGLTLGVLTTYPPDVAALSQIGNYILMQEPDWAPLLWMNWDGISVLTVEVRGLYTLAQTINSVPWWSYWPDYPTAAANIIGALYLMAIAQEATTAMAAEARRAA